MRSELKRSVVALGSKSIVRHLPVRDASVIAYGSLIAYASVIAYGSLSLTLTELDP
jgi:hypothetical protein